MKIFYSPDYVGSTHDFETTRKAKWVADSLSRSPVGALDLVPPEPLIAEQLAQVHDPEYVRAVRIPVTHASNYPWCGTPANT